MSSYERQITYEETARNDVYRQVKVNIDKWGYRDHHPSTWHEIIQQQAGQLADAGLNLKEAGDLETMREAERQYNQELKHVGAACINALTESYLHRSDRNRKGVSDDAHVMTLEGVLEEFDAEARAILAEKQQAADSGGPDDWVQEQLEDIDVLTDAFQRLGLNLNEQEGQR